MINIFILLDELSIFFIKRLEKLKKNQKIEKLEKLQ
jgi:hypothetical protein